jgi:hypothetical protein
LAGIITHEAVSPLCFESARLKEISTSIPAKKRIFNGYVAGMGFNGFALRHWLPIRIYRKGELEDGDSLHPGV